MERGLILLVATLMGCLALGVHGSTHLTFSNDIRVNITRTGCGTTKVCLSTPEGCDPQSNNCLFTSLITTSVVTNNTNLTVQLSGESEGYIALGITRNLFVGNASVFICTRNTTSASTFFSTQLKDNTASGGSLTSTETVVRDIRGTVNGKLIQCEFVVPNVNASVNPKASEDTTFNVLLGSGTATNGNIGPLTVDLTRGPLDLSNAAAAVTTTTPTTTSTTTTTTTTTTTSATTSATTTLATTLATTMATTMATAMATTAGASGASLPHVVLVLLSALVGPAMLRT